MSSPRKFPRISNHALAATLARLVKEAQKQGGIAKAKLVEAMNAVRQFQIIMLDNVALTGRHGNMTTEVFMTTFLESLSDEDKSLFRAMSDVNFEQAFNVILSTNPGTTAEEQVASFVGALEEFTYVEPDKSELLSELARQASSFAAGGAASTNVGGSSSAAGGAEPASPIAKSKVSAPSASSSSFVPAASPARPQQNENAVAGRTYIKVVYDAKESFKKSMTAFKLSFGWDQMNRAWYCMTTDSDILAEIVAEGWEVLPNPNEE